MKRSRPFIDRNKHYLNSGEQQESQMNIYIYFKIKFSQHLKIKIKIKILKHYMIVSLLIMSIPFFRYIIMQLSPDHLSLNIGYCIMSICKHQFYKYLELTCMNSTFKRMFAYICSIRYFLLVLNCVHLFLVFLWQKITLCICNIPNCVDLIGLK